MAGINIREIGLDTLIEILEHGQFSHIYLRAVLDKYGFLQKQERAFLGRLVTGTIERKLELEYIINSCSKTKVRKMKPLIRTALLMGTYELYYMDGVPDSATCNEYVKLAKKRGFAGLSGFVNGVLRTIARGKDSLIIEDPAISYSMPQWIFDMWQADYGCEQAQAICQGFFEKEDLCIRVNENKISREALIKLFEEAGIKAVAEESLDSAIYLSGYDSVTGLPGFEEGLFYVQDYSSQLVCQLAEIQPDDQILDMCAAPGGKAIHAAALASQGHVLARDLTQAKVDLINENIARVGADNIDTQVWDATVEEPEQLEGYDLVIADLPCSGLGIIRKKPDIKYNQTPESLQELEALQAKILDVAAGYVRHGGKLSYSTCTINRGENDGQVAAFLTRHPDYEIADSRQLLPDDKHDGFYICVMKRKI